MERREIARRNDLNPSPWIEREEISIATDNAIAFGIERQCENRLLPGPAQSVTSEITETMVVT